MAVEEERIVIEWGDKMVSLQVHNFSTDVDVEDILKIDYSNLLGEILTWPVLYNRIANLKAEIDHEVRIQKFDFEIFEANLREEVRRKLSGLKTGRVTLDEIDTEVKMNINYRSLQEQIFKRQKDAQILDNLYWSAQSKTQLLQRLSEKIRPEEFNGELLSDVVNGVLIKTHNKSIPDIT